MRYIYGADIKGIQDYIYRTNVLKDIIGASELIEDLSKNGLALVLGKDYDDSKCIINSAGHIKYIFENETELKKVVREMPKTVLEKAPGLVFSQAVVKNNGSISDINLLEKRLAAQRNRPIRSLQYSPIGVKRYGLTGFPSEYLEENKKREDRDSIVKKEYAESGHIELAKKCFGTGVNPIVLARDIQDITGANDWIAVIHADGNSLGKIVTKLGNNLEVFRDFSKKLEEITKNSANQAYATIMQETVAEKKIPIRPVVLGGDDLTVICRGDIAMRYTASFLRYFENNSKKMLGECFNKYNVGCENISACAGIAFIKSSFPFYYGYKLAEDLCEFAKKKTKYDGKPFGESCIMFHKVQDSFIVDYKQIINKELSISKDISLQFGPYYIDEKENGYWTVDDLLETAAKLEGEKGNTVRSNVRQWLSTLYENTYKAKQLKNRMLAMTTDKDLLETLIGEKDCEDDVFPAYVFPAYDVLSINTVINQVTK